jgi:chromosome segregation ATPase
MSLLPFARNFFTVQGNNAAAAVTKALVNLDPEGASAADLMSMEQDLDRAGGVIAKLRKDLVTEQREFDALNRQYTELMGAAEILQKKLDGGDASVEASLASLVGKIENIAPELERDRKDVDATQKLITEAENAYQQKAAALTGAKRNLDAARHDLAHANIQEERARERAQQAAVVAGLTKSPTSGLTVALNVMQQSADDARQRAESADMKAAALHHAGNDAADDPNIAEALAEVHGAASTKSLSERLAALKK